MGNPRTFMIFITIQLFSMVMAQELAKRVPQGFFGVRGKKYIEDETERFYKRKPQFFVGVKGKKSLADILDMSDEHYKRTPTGFLGMRGKKDADSFDSNEYVPKRDGSLIGQIDYSSNEFNGKELPLLDELLMGYLHRLDQSLEKESDESDTGLTNEVEKRAANLHQFFGVRGKKSLNNKRPYDLTFRGKFIGVRGKKDLNNSGVHDIKFLLNNDVLPKRKAPMGFFGMRGKKWTDEEFNSEMETPN